MYLVLKSTGFLRCVLCPGESVHVFSAVLTCLQVRFYNTLSDALCESKTADTHERDCLPHSGRRRESVAECSSGLVYICADHGSVTMNNQMLCTTPLLRLPQMPPTRPSANGSSTNLISAAVKIFSISCTYNIPQSQYLLVVSFKRPQSPIQSRLAVYNGQQPYRRKIKYKFILPQGLSRRFSKTCLCFLTSINTTTPASHYLSLLFSLLSYCLCPVSFAHFILYLCPCVYFILFCCFFPAMYHFGSWPCHSSSVFLHNLVFKSYLLLFHRAIFHSLFSPFCPYPC